MLKNMKDVSRAPAYACLYHGLAEIARKHGYSLAIHGSLQKDLDLVAIPWIEDADDKEILVEALRKHCEACITLISSDVNPEQKPHGRIAWNLYMEHGAKVDLSVMPMKKKEAK